MNQAFFSFIEFFIKEKVSTFNSFFRSKRRIEEKEGSFTHLEREFRTGFSILPYIINSPIGLLIKRKETEGVPFQEAKSAHSEEQALSQIIEEVYF